MKYEVVVVQPYIQRSIYQVEADNPDEACDKVDLGRDLPDMMYDLEESMPAAILKVVHAGTYL